MREKPQASARLLDKCHTVLKDFHVEKKIGDGAYSVVYAVIRKSDLKEYALKQVKI
jgi:serine/threonine protein kinase